MPKKQMSSAEAQKYDTARARELRAIEMRTARATYAQIAEALGLSNASAARTIVERALASRAAEQARPRDMLIQEQLDLINRLIRARYTDAMATRPVINPSLFGASDAEALARALEAANAVSGIAIRATDSIARLLQQEARLLGLNAPVRMAMDVKVTDQMMAEIEDLVQQMSALDAQAAQQKAAQSRG